MSDLQETSNGLCAAFGCTPYESSGNDNDPDGIVRTIYNLATFDADIGLPESYQYLFSFIFFWIPLVILILAGLMYIPLT